MGRSWRWLPHPGKGIISALVPAQRILLHAYHQRRTWTCFGSYHPKGRDAVLELLEDLPDEKAQRELRQLGFTTVIMSHPKMSPGRILKHRFEKNRKMRSSIVHTTENMTAYELRS